MVGPEPGELPLDDGDLAGDVEAVELPPTAAADGDQLALDALPPGLGDAAERCTLQACAVRELDEGLLQPPGVDRHRLLDHVLEAEAPHLVRDEGRRLALLGRSCDAEAERVGADRLQPFHDVPQVLR